MVLYGLVEILKLKSKPLMNGRGYVVGNGRGYGVIQNSQSVSQSVTKVGIELLGQLKIIRFVPFAIYNHHIKLD